MYLYMLNNKCKIDLYIYIYMYEFDTYRKFYKKNILFYIILFFYLNQI